MTEELIWFEVKMLRLAILGEVGYAEAYIESK